VTKAREGQIFGARVRELRLARSWTQEDLADAAALTATYVGQVERGDKVPSLSVVLRLARALSVTPAELLVGFTPAVLRGMKF
jgi:transcriptional regulator with XRE-family HTH domain